MDEEKTIDEAVEEQADEMKEFEPVAFDEVIKDEPAKETAPVLRALGDPDPANMDMIHKHLDNFLAMLCGETPIDDNVRNSTEYWLKRLADGLGGSTKKIYWHTIYFKREGDSRWYTDGYVIILNNDPTPIDADAFISLLETPGFYAVVYNGRIKRVAGGTLDACNESLCAISYRDVTDSIYVHYLSDPPNQVRGTSDIALSGIVVTDLGANPIN